MRLVEGVLGAACVRGPGSFRRRDARIEIDATEGHQAERFAHHFHVAHGFPKADGQADHRIDFARTNRTGRIGGVFLAAQVAQGDAAQGDRQDA